MGWCMGGWVDWWVGSCQSTKNWIKLDLIEIIQFCFKIMICWNTPTYGLVYGWCWILDSFKWNKQRRMYAHLKNLFLVDVVILLYKYEVIWHGNYTGIYTSIWIDLRRTLRYHIRQKCELRIEWGWDPEGGKCHLTFCLAINTYKCQQGNSLTLKFSKLKGNNQMLFMQLRSLCHLTSYWINSIFVNMSLLTDITTGG